MTTTKNNENKKLNFSNEREQSQACLNSAEHEKNQGRKVLNVPNLRFPEFQGEWEESTIGEMFDLYSGNTPSRLNKEHFKGTVNWISSGELKEHYIYSSKEQISEEAAKSLKLLPVGTFVIAIYGLEAEGVRGTGSITQKPSTISQACMSFIPKGVIENEFLYSWYKKHGNVIGIRYAQGTKQQNLSYDILEKFKIVYPNTKEQEKLNKFISLLDERIATQNKIIDKLQALIRGLNDSLYAQYGGDVLTSFAKLGTSYSGLSGKSAQDFGSGKPFITYLNVYSNNVINENDFQYVAIKDGEKQNVAEYGDVLFTLSSETPEEVGIGSVFLGKEKVYLNSFCFGIHITNKEVAFPPYLSYYVSSTAFRKFIYPYAQGSTRFNLCKADFEKASIKLPTLENQKRIYSILGHIDCKIETERQLLALYNTQKQYLLRQMFI